ncbi:hypothetical protein HPB48_022392 [Haemaphysalis longicornis]|uniref:Uncharacterized protein n=1 Tax=Haemaphysalis longicornis TaxID=44386 RepID=A0A9J6FY20_HAELO|nr:hypothetical protein HPB48_022392 [Haemaphysalis longicornis]
MFECARRNGFPLPNTACLLNRVREQAHNNDQECLNDQKKALEDCPIRRRHLIMTLSNFSLIFAFYVAMFSQNPGQGTLFQWVSFSVVLLAYAVMHCLIVRWPLVKVLELCYFMMGVIQSLRALAAYIQPAIVTELLLILSKACVAVALVTSVAYTLELVPTAVRASALLVTFGGGSIGSVCASVFFVLQKVGREDVAFFPRGIPSVSFDGVP